MKEERLKNSLDVFAELLFNYFLLSRALFCNKLHGYDRAVYHNAFKGLIDILRYGQTTTGDAFTMKTRYETIQENLNNETSSLNSIFTQFMTWQAKHYSPALLNTELIIKSFYIVLTSINTLGRLINKEISEISEAPPLFETLYISDEHQSDTPPSYPNKVSLIYYQKLVEDGRGVVKAVWPTYYHIFMIIENDIDERELEEVIYRINSIIRSCQIDIQKTRLPMLISIDMLRPLLYSCYLNNPFRYYDFLNEKVYSNNPNLKDEINEPPSFLLIAMAKEVLSHTLVNARKDIKRMKDSYEIYRLALTAVRLKIFFNLQKIIIPLSGVYDFYNQTYPNESDWIKSLKEECLTNSITGKANLERLFYRYYIKIKTILDSVAENIL